MSGALANPPSSATGGPAPRCRLCRAQTELLHGHRPASIYQCAECGFAFQSYESVAQVRALYTREYFETYSDGREYESDHRARRYESRVRVALLARFTPPPGRLLEVGAAAGEFLRSVRTDGYDAVGIEPQADMASRARQRSGAPVLADFLEDVDLPERAFDVACGWHVIEHLPDPVAALRQICSALRPGGHLFIEVPNFASVGSRRQALDWPYLDLPHHVNQFGPGSLRRAVEEAGFRVLIVETVSVFRYFPPSVALRPSWMARRARLSVRTRAPLTMTHPWKHDLLRLVACRVSA